MKRERPIHKREGSAFGISNDRIFIACSRFGASVSLPNSDEWPDVTCLQCLAKKPKTVK